MSFETSVVVESEVIARPNVRPEAKTNIMISGRGGSKWQSKIGKSSIVSVKQRDASGSGSKRQRDCSMGDEDRRGLHDRSRSSHMEDQSNQRDHDQLSLNVPWIIGSGRQRDSNTRTTIHDPTHPDSPLSSLLDVFEIPSQH